MAIKYNVYYSTTPNGPWTKANPSPIADVAAGNHYKITGLKAGVLYYIIVVGGKINELNGEWVALSGQSIGPESLEAVDLTSPNVIAVRTYIPRTTSTSKLGLTFTVV